MGLLNVIPGKLAYTVTDFGLQAALFYTHAYDSLIAPGMADLSPSITAAPSPVRRAYEAFSRAWHQQTDADGCRHQAHCMTLTSLVKLHPLKNPS